MDMDLARIPAAAKRMILFIGHVLIGLSTLIASPSAIAQIPAEVYEGELRTLPEDLPVPVIQPTVLPDPEDPTIRQPRCPYSELKVLYNDSQRGLTLTSYGSSMVCAKEIFDEILESCDLFQCVAERLFNYVDDSDRPKNFDFESDFSIFFSPECRPLKQPSVSSLQLICDLGTFEWRKSPISLIWNRGHEIGARHTITDFRLEPGVSGRSYRWYASSDAPLLVWDPSHRGIVRDGAQLFGNWTFGGQRIASLEGVTAELRTEWKNGYEALATLDRDGDGEISGDELAPLALWFDANRDGISQKGEVRALAKEGVTRLWYSPTGTDTRRNITASRGYERIVNGRVHQGASVDWFAEGDRNRATLVSKTLAEERVCGAIRPAPASVLIEDSTSQVPRGSDTKNSPGLEGAHQMVRREISGIWEWRMNVDAVSERGFEPQGYLTFGEDPSGRLKGHSFQETPFVKGGDIGSVLSASALKGKREDEQTFSFEITSHSIAQTSLHSTVRIRDDSVLEGKTFVHQIDHGVPRRFTYTWTARRKSK